jgi:zinc transport system substrate-binding protein
MKKLLIILLLTTFSFATKTHVVVSILPQKIFVDKIGGDRIDSTVMVQAGASPHNYEPKPSQMKEITDANLYLSIDVEFEKVWLEKFKNQNRDLIVFDISKDINKSSMETDHHEEKHHSNEEVESKDPHVWVNPLNVKIIAQNIFTALSSLDKNNTAYYQKNLNIYLKELDILDTQIEDILKDTPKGSSFMVFHPAWGYFAQRYHLKQLAVEVEGKEPKMKALIRLMKKAKKEKVQAIFTQPEFSDKSAQIIANNLNIQVIKTSPLAENWSKNLLNLAKAIANKN